VRTTKTTRHVLQLSIMDGQTAEDKLSVLTNIFGNDLTQSVISNTLRDNNNQFDPAVERLLTLPANKVTPPPTQPTQAQQPLDGKGIENIQRLHTMFGDLTQSVITTVYESNQRDVEGTVDTLLNLTSNEVASGARRDAEVARQEQELREYEEFKQLQQRLQEQERRATEEAQQRAKDAEQKKKAEEEAQRKAHHEKKMQDEHAKALQEQERMLLEFQRRKAVEEQERVKKLAEEQEKAKAKKLAEEQDKVKKAQTQQEREKAALEKKIADEKVRIEAETKAREEAKRAEEKRLTEERRVNEERLALKKLEAANLELQKQKQVAEAERKILEARMKEEIQREEEERKKFAENERRLREEQEDIKKNWEEKVRKLEKERRLEEQMRKEEEIKRAEVRRAEEEERARHEADMRKILELERLKLDEQRKRVEEEKRNAEERLLAMELAAKKREEEEVVRARLEEERRQQEEERRREEEERIRLLEEETQARERLREEMSKAAAQEQFAASAIMVPPAGDEPKVQIVAEVEGTEIHGTWNLLSGILAPQAWLGLFAKRSINTYTGFQYVNGTTGTFRFKGLTPGHYEVRIFSSKPVTSRIAESVTMLIGPQVISFNAQMQGEHIMFDYKLDPPSVPTAWDWVGIYEKTQRRNKNYLSSTYGNTSGTISATLPRTPGEYQARLFAAGAKYNEQATVEFEVVDNDHVTAEQVQDGTIKASWVLRTVEPTSSDWIGLFAAGEVSNKYLASVYTHGATAGAVDIPLPKDIPAGTYELRLFSNKVGKYTTFKVSTIITIS